MSKKNKIILFSIFFIIIGIVLFIWFNSNNMTQQSGEYVANRTSANENQSNNDVENNPLSIENNANNTSSAPPQPPQIKEEELATFSTKIYSTDSARQNNVQITCNTLNNSIVKNGDTFSFCNTVGQSSTSKGYQKADIFDSNGNKKKGLGGGNCQVSSTLYNAVLNTPRFSCYRKA